MVQDDVTRPFTGCSVGGGPEGLRYERSYAEDWIEISDLRQERNERFGQAMNWLGKDGTGDQYRNGEDCCDKAQARYGIRLGKATVQEAVDPPFEKLGIVQRAPCGNRDSPAAKCRQSRHLYQCRCEIDGPAMVAADSSRVGAGLGGHVPVVFKA